MAELTSQQRTPPDGCEQPVWQSWSLWQWTVHIPPPLLEPLPPPLEPPLEEPELLELTVLSIGASYVDPVPLSSPKETVESPEPHAATLAAIRTKATLVQSFATLMGTPFLCE
jgi:hypothetical protein